VKKLIREPLVHFVLLGAAYGFLKREPAANPQRIVVSPGQIELVN
jgi:hypothetical protein